MLYCPLSKLHNSEIFDRALEQLTFFGDIREFPFKDLFQLDQGILIDNLDLYRADRILLGHICDTGDLVVAHDQEIARRYLQLGAAHADFPDRVGFPVVFHNIADAKRLLKYDKDPRKDVRDQILGSQRKRQSADPERRDHCAVQEPQIAQ